MHGLGEALVLMFWLSIIGIVAMIGGAAALIVWLVTHVSIGIA